MSCFYQLSSWVTSTAILLNLPTQKLKPLMMFAINSHKWLQIIDKPKSWVTVETESLIDIIMVSSPDLIKESSLLHFEIENT